MVSEHGMPFDVKKDLQKIPSVSNCIDLQYLRIFLDLHPTNSACQCHSLQVQLVRPSLGQKTLLPTLLYLPLVEHQSSVVDPIF